MAKINNKPDETEKYIVARVDEADFSLWFWGSWDDVEEASTVALELGNAVVIERGCDESI